MKILHAQNTVLQAQLYKIKLEIGWSSHTMSYKNETKYDQNIKYNIWHCNNS